MPQFQERFGRRSIALFWLAIVALVVFTLIYLEQIAVLYVVATLSLVVLLLIVGFSDLEKVGREDSTGFAPKGE